MRSGNPVLSEGTFRGLRGAGGEVMTVEGTVNKGLVLSVVVFAAAAFTWNMAVGDSPALMPVTIIGAIAGLLVAIATAFKKEWAPVTAPLYAGLEGLVLGGASALAEMAYPGIAMQAVGITAATMFTMLAAYRTGLIKVTDKFRMGIVAATGGIMLFYLITFALSFFGINMTRLFGGGLLAIGISLVIVAVAALNLVLDFDFISEGARAGAPRYMEWYGAFALMVTLVWLYFEILRLLTYIRGRD